MKVLWPLEFRSRVIDCYSMQAGSSGINTMFHFLYLHLLMSNSEFGRFLHVIWTNEAMLLKPLAHFEMYYPCFVFSSRPFNSVFATPGWPIPHQSASDAHELLPVCHGHHDVLLRGHQRAARQSTANQRRLLPWEGTAVWCSSAEAPVGGCNCIKSRPFLCRWRCQRVRKQKSESYVRTATWTNVRKNTSCLLNLGNTIRDIRALWMHYFRNVGFLQPKIYKCLFPVV